MLILFLLHHSQYVYVYREEVHRLNVLCLFMYKTLWLPQVPYKVYRTVLRCESQVVKQFSVKVFAA